MQYETAEVNETPLIQIKENKMKHLLTLTLFLGIAWGQSQYVTVGTGLELETINDFDILVESYDDNPIYKNIGLTSQYIETKVKLALRSNGIIPEGTKSSSRYLYVNINMLYDMGYIVNIALQFKRPVQYLINEDLTVLHKFDDVDNVRYKFGVATYSKNMLVTTPSQGALGHIVSQLVIMIDKFSLALLEANGK